jgi:hypothetical protein
MCVKQWSLAVSTFLEDVEDPFLIEGQVTGQPRSTGVTRWDEFYMLFRAQRPMKTGRMSDTVDVCGRSP